MTFRRGSALHRLGPGGLERCCLDCGLWALQAGNFYYNAKSGFVSRCIACNSVYQRTIRERYGRKDLGRRLHDVPQIKRAVGRVPAVPTIAQLLGVA